MASYAPRGAWHARAVGGWAFAFGNDSPDDGPYAGADVGYTWASGWGLDAFYRFASMTFPVTGVPGLTEDGGDFHTVGGKVTYQTVLGAGSRWWLLAGIGAGYTFATRFEDSGGGFGGYGELGIGYRLGRNVSLMLAVNAQGFQSEAGRSDPSCGCKRWLWTVAPVVGVQVDF